MECYDETCTLDIFGYPLLSSRRSSILIPHCTMINIHKQVKESTGEKIDFKKLNIVIPHTPNLAIPLLTVKDCLLARHLSYFVSKLKAGSFPLLVSKYNYTMVLDVVASKGLRM